jgi:hypothetical protein
MTLHIVLEIVGILFVIGSVVLLYTAEKYKKGLIESYEEALNVYKSTVASYKELTSNLIEANEQYREALRTERRQTSE